jgi:endonuclease YncB( thermonuclease family)
MRTWGWSWAVVACELIAIAGCDRGATAETPVQRVEVGATRTGGSEREGTNAERGAEQEGLLIGEFELTDHPIVDGDTIRVQGIEDSIRLLSIDTEEKLRSRADRKAASEDFEEYLRKKRGNATRPQKPGTPMGEQATEFAEAFFAGAEVVRLERDDPKDIRGRYGRLLAYAFVKKNGRWTSYNVECVRAGMSPYFTKYGYSHRFHNQLSHAEAEARDAGRGIWDPSSKGYGDYQERKAWWNARADFIRAFEQEANRRSDYIRLTQSDALQKLEDNLDREVTVLSTIDRIKHFKGLIRVNLALQRGGAFPLIFFDKDAYRLSGIERYKSEPVAVRGKVERYEKGEYRTLQIVVDDPAQLTLPSLPWTEGSRQTPD